MIAESLRSIIWDLQAVAAVHQTLKSLFPQLRVFITEKKEFTDFVFLARKSRSI